MATGTLRVGSGVPTERGPTTSASASGTSTIVSSVPEEVERATAPGRGRRGGRSAPNKTEAGSLINVIHGTAEVKAYPIFKDELWTLGAQGLLSSVLLSLMWTCINFYVDTMRDLELNPGIPAATIGHWQRFNDFALAGAVLLFLGSVVVFITGALKINAIINRTTFKSK
jgi:hypothetical protein